MKDLDWVFFILIIFDIAVVVFMWRAFRKYIFQPKGKVDPKLALKKNRWPRRWLRRL